MAKTIRIGEVFIVFGLSKQFGIGFNINRWSFSLDFLCLWMSVEW